MKSIQPHPGTHRGARRGLLAALSGLLLVAQFSIVVGTASAAPVSQVTICHRTNSAGNPYVVLTDDVSGSDGTGPTDHLHHTGPVFDPATMHSGDNWGDIIPPFDDDGNAMPAGGLNWTTAGQAIWGNDCKPPNPPDVKITKSSSSTSVTAGDTFTFTLKVDNIGDTVATLVRVTDTIPAGLQITDTSGCSNASPISGQTVTCDLGDIAKGASKSMTITVKALAGACPSVSNTATVSADNEPLDKTGNNTSNTVTVNVNCPTPDVKVTKSASSTSVAVGASVTFTLTAENIGAGTATNVVVTDVIPTGMTFASASAGCQPNGSTVTCGLGDLPAGGTRSVGITVTATVGACPSVNNKATVTAGNEPGGATGNNTSNTVTINVTCPDPDVQISKSSNAPATGVAPGDTFTYTISVTNAGGAEATGVEIQDTVPVGLSITEYPSNCSVIGRDLACDLGTVATGATESVTITVKASADACPMVTNNATVTATNESDTNDDNNTSNPVTTLVNCEPPPEPEPGVSVRIVKTNDANRDGNYSDNEEAKRPDADVPFLLVITNTGETAVEIGDLTDSFGGQTVNLLRDKCSELRGLTLQPGESATCNFTLNGYSPAHGSPLENTAEICATEAGGNRDDCDTDTSTVRSAEVLGRTITPTKTPPGGTAFTGSEGTLGFGGIALALLLLGSGLVWAGYRRRQQYDG